MCSDDVASYGFSSNNPIQWCTQELLVDNSETNYCCCEGKAKWYLQSWVRRETTYFGRDAQFIVFVRYRATEVYVEQIFFCCPLVKHTARKEIFNEVDSFNKEHQSSRTLCVSICADGAYSVMIRIKKALWYYEREKQKYIGRHCLLLR